jgi:hypothetical protein
MAVLPFAQAASTNCTLLLIVYALAILFGSVHPFAITSQLIVSPTFTVSEPLDELNLFSTTLPFTYRYISPSVLVSVKVQLSVAPPVGVGVGVDDDVGVGVNVPVTVGVGVNVPVIVGVGPKPEAVGDGDGVGVGPAVTDVVTHIG